MRTETVYQCSKCGQVTPWDSSLSGPVLCQRHWDAATETDPERARYMRAYNRAYYEINNIYSQNRWKYLQRAKEWRRNNPDRYNENQRLLMRQRREKEKVAVTT